MRNDVLIIGAGPSGLFAAAELARHGVEARLIGREVRPHREARATAIQPGTLEILDTVGLLPPFLDAAEHSRCSRLYGPDMSEVAAMSHDGIDCRCEFQCRLPQYETRRILEAHLASLGGGVARGVTATKVETDAAGVFVELVHADGKVETVHPSVVIGAGGAHSVTRHSMREPLEGTTYRGHFLVADIAMPAPFPRDEAGVVCGPNGLLLLAPLPGGRWISFQDLEEDVETVAAEAPSVPYRDSSLCQCPRLGTRMVAYPISAYTFPHEARIHQVRFDEGYMHVELTDGRVLSVPLWCIPTLDNPLPEERQKYEINQSRTMLIWDPDKCAITDKVRIAGYLGPGTKDTSVDSNRYQGR